MLGEANVYAMVAVKDIDKAKEFYGQTLGLKQVDENMAGVMYQSGNGRIFVYASPYAGTTQATTANWDVTDLKAAIEALKGKGVTDWQSYEFPGAEHEGEIHVMGPFKAAWFKDPDGNILGLSEVSS